MAPPAKEAEWDAWERRNPGVMHPDRQKERNARGRRAFLEDWEQGTARFAREELSFAERARQARLRNRSTRL